MMTPVAFVFYILEVSAVVLWTTKWSLPLRVFFLAMLLVVTAAVSEWLVLTD